MQSDTAEGILTRKGYRKGENFMYIIDEGAGHHESAWGYRLYDALKFLGEPWSEGTAGADAEAEAEADQSVDDGAEQSEGELTAR